jgi:hypothetical protein
MFHHLECHATAVSSASQTEDARAFASPELGNWLNRRESGLKTCLTRLKTCLARLKVAVF